MKIIKNFLKENVVKDYQKYLKVCFFFFEPEFSNLESQIVLPDFEIYKNVGFNVEEITLVDYGLFMKHLFDGCEVIDRQSVGSGQPDFIIRKNNMELYVELKVDEDRPGLNQLLWMSKNYKNKSCCLLFINSKVFEKLPDSFNTSNSSGFKFRKLPI